ncbi:lipid-A-disaccharide synthase [Limoniibacter endophyticus]|uniref:Lipid-A-disaccharide synthase n=1 Tax=Limoniibacter endophyticus TaxID=1565040 RepID=A0A8J3DLM0_9HYPH|nr:lipid-A-disaccharide synthase [Limoniibacter endophyticus]GHC62036.1 lipid-A-disaccharide synthase [Limoniibacter endophyticus]
MTERPLRIGIVAGEESGDLLGADLVRALRQGSGRDVELFGVGGRHLIAEGLTSLFDSSEIALMGLSAIIRDLPRLMRRIGQTAQALANAGLDCLITIDSPEFALRVAKKTRATAPGLPIVHYVCPSVWAWRPQRAPAMKPYVDHILCVLPFETSVLKALNGPQGTYVGHRLASNPALVKAREAQMSRDRTELKTLLVLPGSRGSEIDALLPAFGETISTLVERGNDFHVLLPSVPRHAEKIRELAKAWRVSAEILVDDAAKWEAFGKADAALAASGTVLLELALARVPMLSCYRTDFAMRLFTHLITSWSGALPNIIADRPIVTEFYDKMIRPGLLARAIEGLTQHQPTRYAHLAGLDEVWDAMQTERPSGEIAAEVVLAEIAKQKGR